MSEHLCHADGCKTEVPPRMHMCKPHWFAVPKALRDALWDAYTPGQERHKNPSAEYLIAAERCITSVAVKEGLITQEVADQRVAFWEAEAEDVAAMMGGPDV